VKTPITHSPSSAKIEETAKIRSPPHLEAGRKKSPKLEFEPSMPRIGGAHHTARQHFRMHSAGIAAYGAPSPPRREFRNPDEAGPCGREAAAGKETCGGGLPNPRQPGWPHHNLPLSDLAANPDCTGSVLTIDASGGLEIPGALAPPLQGLIRQSLGFTPAAAGQQESQGAARQRSLSHSGKRRPRSSTFLNFFLDIEIRPGMGRSCENTDYTLARSEGNR
jgi:hypothetical protein